MKTTHTLLFSVFIAAASGFVHATPIVFTESRYTTFAQANAGDVSNGLDSAIATTRLPINSAVDVVSPNADSASAVAFADTLFLTTTTEASGVTGMAASSAVATFTGLFNAAPGLLDLSLLFDAFSDQQESGFASNSLVVNLEVGGITLLNDILFNAVSFKQQFLLATGGAGLFDLTLTGTSDAVAGDYAFSLASVNAALDATPTTVPEPASLALLFAGLLGWFLLVAARNRMREHAPKLV